jgi:TonB family protein
MAAGKKNGLTLRITGPDGSRQESVSEAESVIVGSGAGAGVRLRDPKVSNLHVMLKVDAQGGVTAIDLGSEGGTEVGGQRLVTPRVLAPGDVLRVGGSRLEVLFGELVEQVAPAGAEVSAPLQGSVAVPVGEPVVAAEAGAGNLAVGASGTGSAQVGGRGAGNAVVREVASRGSAVPGNAMVPPGSRGRTASRSLAQAASVKERKPAVPAHLQEPLPPEARPAKDARVLQVSLLWGDRLLEVRHFRDGAPVTIGQGGRNVFQVFDAQVGARHRLAMARGEQCELRVPEGSGVIVTRDGDVRTKEQLRSDGRLKSSGREQVYTLELHERAEVELGTLTFVVRFVRPSPLVRMSTMDDADFTFFKIAAIGLMLAAAVIAAMLLTPRSEVLTQDDIFASQQRVAKFLVTPQKKLEAKKLNLQGVEEGAKAKDEEGKFGKEEAKKPEADPSKPGTPLVNKNKKEEDRKRVGQVGLLGAMKGLKGEASSVFGPGGLGTGINNALGGLKGGAGLGDAQGLGGLGSRGHGSGGGGTALGLGGLGTQGTGRGTGGSGGIDLGGRGKTITQIIPGKTTVIGGLDKDVIAKVIRRHQNEIKYCYETELSKDPDLAGKVAVAFTIDPTGAVSEATVTESTLNNPTAERCMLSRIRRWKFPEPKGGGVVAVTYPWLFSPAGGQG